MASERKVYSLNFDPPDAALQGVGVHLGFYAGAEIALARTKEVVAAASPSAISASCERGRSRPDPTNEASLYTAKWRSLGQEFLLEARTFRDGERRGGTVSVWRPSPGKVQETWTLEDGTLLRIQKLEIKEDWRGEKTLWLRYLTNGFLLDPVSWNREAELMWPRLREILRKENPSKVLITRCDAIGSLIGEDGPTQRADGEWERPEKGPCPFLPRSP